MIEHDAAMVTVILTRGTVDDAAQAVIDLASERALQSFETSFTWVEANGEWVVEISWPIDLDEALVA
jgi:hypothetical protein